MPIKVSYFQVLKKKKTKYPKVQPFYSPGDAKIIQKYTENLYSICCDAPSSGSFLFGKVNKILLNCLMRIHILKRVVK